MKVLGEVRENGGAQCPVPGFPEVCPIDHCNFTLGSQPTSRDPIVAPLEFLWEGLTVADAWKWREAYPEAALASPVLSCDAGEVNEADGD